MRISLKDLLAVVLSGALTALAFPRLSLSFLAWVSLIPLFFVLSRHTTGRSFILGSLGGLVFYGILLFWIPAVPAHYGNLSATTGILIYLLLILLLSLFWGLFGLVFTRIGIRFRALAFILAPFLWIGMEYLLTFVLSGFPWGLLGYTQYRDLPLIQSATLAGVFGISFLLVLFQSLAVFSLRLKTPLPFFVGLGVVVTIHAAGLFSLSKVKPTAESFPAAVVQGNVSADINWNLIEPKEAEALFDRHLNLTRAALKDGARFVVWPEFSIPLCFSCPDPYYQDNKAKLVHLTRTSGATLVLGSVETGGTEDAPRYFNSALSLSPDGSVSQYAKMHLVPFGEYVPYSGVLSWVRNMTSAIGQVSRGRDYVLHPYGNLEFASPICYEIIFPDLVRKFVRDGADFLVTITNDSWYGGSWAPRQHFAIAVLRAVENRRFLLRAATTGISGIVDPYGRILARSKLMTPAVLNGTVTPLRTKTLYTRYGDWLPLAGLTISFFFFMLAFLTRSHERQKRDGSRSII